jgi:hypothetical protein
MARISQTQGEWISPGATAAIVGMAGANAPAQDRTTREEPDEVAIRGRRT